jgi:hypothetical protein
MNLDIRVLTFPLNPIVRGDRTHGLLSHNLTPVRSALVFFAPEESFHTIRNAEDLSALLAKCGERALAIFEEKLDLSKRLGRSGRAQLGPEELNGL